MTKFAMVFRWYCHTYPSQFPQKSRLFFVAISTIQVFMETSTKLSLHVSSPSKWVNPMNRRNYDETSSQLRRTTVAITMKLRHNWDEKLCQDNNLRHSCWMCNESPSQRVTNICGNIDECNISKPNLRCTCCICDEYSCKLRWSFIVISTIHWVNPFWWWWHVES